MFKTVELEQLWSRPVFAKPTKSARANAWNPIWLKQKESLGRCNSGNEDHTSTGRLGTKSPECCRCGQVLRCFLQPQRYRKWEIILHAPATQLNSLISMNLRNQQNQTDQVMIASSKTLNKGSYRQDVLPNKMVMLDPRKASMQTPMEMYESLE